MRTREPERSRDPRRKRRGFRIRGHTLAQSRPIPDTPGCARVGRGAILRAMASKLAGFFFIDAAGKIHRAEGARSFLSAKAAKARKRCFSPEESIRLGVDFGTEWTEEGAARAAELATKEATRGLDDVDLAPESEPADATEEEGPTEDAAPAPEAPRPTPDAPAPAAPTPAAAPSGPVEEKLPEPAPDPDAPTEGAANPAASLAALPPDVLVNLLNTVCGKAWGRLVVWAGTPSGMKPIPLAPEEQTAIDDAMRAVLARYLPAMPTNHPELWALALASAMPVVVRRFVLEHEPLPPDPDDDADELDDAPSAAPPRAPRVPAPPPPAAAPRSSRTVFGNAGA